MLAPRDHMLSNKKILTNSTNDSEERRDTHWNSLLAFPEGRGRPGGLRSAFRPSLGSPHPGKNLDFPPLFRLEFKPFQYQSIPYHYPLTLADFWAQWEYCLTQVATLGLPGSLPIPKTRGRGWVTPERRDSQRADRGCEERGEGAL